eukprot:m.106673 g.106673  ORF g.106673 m.106673 type:complete len:440 (-) comp12677_c0_seq6:1442-2761(-)
MTGRMGRLCVAIARTTISNTEIACCATSSSSLVSKSGYCSNEQRRCASSVGNGASFYDERFRRYGNKPLYTFTIGDLVKFEQKHKNDRKLLLLRSGAFLREALPVRLARRILDIYSLPYICGTNPHIQAILNTYIDLFDMFTSFPPITTIEEEKEFVTILKDNLDRARPLLPRLAKASNELAPHMDKNRLSEFVTLMIKSRIGRRVLAEQHIELHRQYFNPRDSNVDDIGAVTMNLDAIAIAKEVFARVQDICRSSYGIAPQLKVVTSTDVKLPYLKSHLEYMFLELFKNATRATIEHFIAQGSEGDLPPVKLEAFPIRTRTTFCISDNGGGIPSEIENSVMEYSFTTVGSAKSAKKSDSNVIGHALSSNPMAGEGFGLPMTKTYAQYFGGDLTFENIHHHGVQFFLRLKHLDRTEYLKNVEEQEGRDESRFHNQPNAE